MNRLCDPGLSRDADSLVFLNQSYPPIEKTQTEDTSHPLGGYLLRAAHSETANKPAGIVRGLYLVVPLWFDQPSDITR